MVIREHNFIKRPGRSNRGRKESGADHARIDKNTKKNIDKAKGVFENREDAEKYREEAVEKFDDHLSVKETKDAAQKMLEREINEIDDEFDEYRSMIADAKFYERGLEADRLAMLEREKEENRIDRVREFFEGNPEGLYVVPGNSRYDTYGRKGSGYMFGSRDVRVGKEVRDKEVEAKEMQDEIIEEIVETLSEDLATTTLKKMVREIITLIDTEPGSDHQNDLGPVRERFAVLNRVLKEVKKKKRENFSVQGDNFVEKLS